MLNRAMAILLAQPDPNMMLAPWVLASLVALAGGLEFAFAFALYPLGRSGTEDVDKRYIKAAVWFTTSWKHALIGTLACLACVIPVIAFELYEDTYLAEVPLNGGLSEMAGGGAILIALAMPYNIVILWKRYWERATGRWFD